MDSKLLLPPKTAEITRRLCRDRFCQSLQLVGSPASIQGPHAMSVPLMLRVLSAAHLSM